MPAISVIVPTYNAQKFLKGCMDSLRNQTFTDYEAICVNDGSTDSSLEILKEYAAMDKRFRIIDQPNGGYGKAMNTGLAAATGKYMAILEPDDLLPQGAYQALMDVVEKKGDMDVVMGCTKGLLNGRIYPLYKLKNTGVVFQVCDYLDAFERGVSTWSAIYRLDFLRANGISYHETPGASFQDAGFHILTLSLAKKIYFTDAYTYIYRRDNPASSTKAPDKVGVLSKEWNYTFEKLAQHPDEFKKVQAACVRRRINSSIWDAMDRISPQGREEALEIFRRDLIEMKKQDMDFSLLTPAQNEVIEEILLSPSVYITMNKVRQYLTSSGGKFVTTSVCRVFGIPLFKIKAYENVRKIYFLGINIIQIREKKSK